MSSPPDDVRTYLVTVIPISALCNSSPCRGMFYSDVNVYKYPDKQSSFNSNLANWNVAKVTTMS